MSVFARRKRGDFNLYKQVGELYDEIRPSLYGYLSSLGLKRDEADDIIQDTFLRLFHHLVEGGRVENARAWTFRVAHNLTLNLHRDRRHLVSDQSTSVADFIAERPDPALNPEESVLQAERMARVASAVSGLTAQQQQCLHLRAEGLRYREIADVIGVSVQRVGDLIQRTLANLAGKV
jgi:RNA polymerase sigma-70 factor (ECF subfamily)